MAEYFLSGKRAKSPPTGEPLLQGKLRILKPFRMILIMRALGYYLVHLRGKLIFLHVPHMQSLFTGGRGDIIVQWEKWAEFISLTETATFLLWRSREYIFSLCKNCQNTWHPKKKN